METAFHLDRELRVDVARPSDRPIIDNLWQLYIHDFSEQWSDSKRGELNADGRFNPYPQIDRYWADEGRIPLLIRNNGALVGFALLNREGHSTRRIDHNMGEFFIVRKYRRKGLGRATTELIFSNYSGVWEVPVARRNLAGIAFWQTVIAVNILVEDAEIISDDANSWDGPIFHFNVKNAVGEI